MSDPEKIAIRNFLEEVKQVITKPASVYEGWVLIRRPENTQCMLNLGLTVKGIGDVVLGLSVADYCQGPLQDWDEPGDLWVFGKVISDREVYIKLKFARFGTLRRLKIVSFHPAKEQLCYPYKKN